MRQVARFLSSVIALVVVSGQTLASEIVVDSFSAAFGNGDPLAGLPPPGNTASKEATTTDSLGGYRKVSITEVQNSTGGSGTSTVSVNVPDDGLRIANSAGISSQVTVVWDGDGYGLGVLPLPYPIPIDITDEASNDGFAISLPAAISQGFGLEFTVADASKGSSVASASVAQGSAGDLFLPFADFTGDAKLEELISITMLLTMPAAGLGGFNLLIADVKATPDPAPPVPTPVPATLPLLSIGLAGITVVRRRPWR